MRLYPTFAPHLYCRLYRERTSDMAIAAAFIILLLAAPAAYAVEHTVGGNSGWDTSVNYVSWAAGQTFTVGDTLMFNYGPSHSVEQVSQNDYTNCNTGNAINSYTGGQSSVPLNAPGPIYFICPTTGHCSQGMKLSISVNAASTPGGTPPATSSPPGTPSTPTPTPGSLTPPPPPPPSRATSLLGNMNYLMVGFSMVLAPVIAFMG